MELHLRSMLGRLHWHLIRYPKCRLTQVVSFIKLTISIILQVTVVNLVIILPQLIATKVVANANIHTPLASVVAIAALVLRHRLARAHLLPVVGHVQLWIGETPAAITDLVVQGQLLLLVEIRIEMASKGGGIALLLSKALVVHSCHLIGLIVALNHVFWSVAWVGDVQETWSVLWLVKLCLYVTIYVVIIGSLLSRLLFVDQISFTIDEAPASIIDLGLKVKASLLLSQLLFLLDLTFQMNLFSIV